MIRKFLWIFFLFQPLLCNPDQVVLDKYVARGLKSNLALQQREFSLEKSLEVLKEAKGLFFPKISLEARYSRAGGGRLIIVPVGDLVNPVYHSLNMLFGFHGIDAGLPTNIPNEVFPFLREREQETKIRVIQPLFQPAIYYNYKLQSALAQVHQVEVSVFKRQLVSEIKCAYYDYAKTLRLIELLDKTRDLLEENLRISENLYQNGKATEDVVYRAKAEIADLDQKRSEAEKNNVLTAMYFNFLINRNLDDSIEIPEKTDGSVPEAVDLETALEHALRHRDEFEQIEYALQASSHQIGLVKSDYLPSVTAVVDYGIQGEEYRFGKDDDYWMASVVLSWTLYKGSQNRSKKAQALLDKKKLEAQKIELEKQIRLQVQDEYYALLAARQAITASRQKEQSAKKSFDIVAKKYKFGTAPQIEFLDARTTYTNAAINHILTRYDYLRRMAKYERASALLDLDKYQDETR